MIQSIKSYEECREFVDGFCDDTQFSDPMLLTEEQLQKNLIKSIETPERYNVFAVFSEAQMMGLFVFLVIPDEQYLEMIVGLSRYKEAYLEMFSYIEEKYQAYEADFVFNPSNYLLKEQLEIRNADFETEAQKMVWNGVIPMIDTMGVEQYTEQYAEQYFAIHAKDMYWTGEKVVAAPERFRTFLAVLDGKVIGYMDVTHCFEENEPFTLYVREEYRRRGYGEKLLAKALVQNQPKRMMILVETDNVPAIRLYEKMGFEKVKNANNLTAHWKVDCSLEKRNI